MEEHLKKIEQRAEALGWDYIRRDDSSATTFPNWSDYALLPCGVGEGALHFFMDKHPECAERLLSLYEEEQAREAKAKTLEYFRRKPKGKSRMRSNGMTRIKIEEMIIAFDDKAISVGDILVSETGEWQVVTAVGDKYITARDITPWYRRACNWIRRLFI